MTRTRKLKDLGGQGARPPEPALPEPPPPDDEPAEAAQQQSPVPAPEPAATASAPPAGDAAAEAKATDHAPEKIDLSSPMAEFGLRIGSLAEARESMMLGYLGMVMAPTVLLLFFISLLDGSDSDGAASLISAMEYMLMVVAALGLPVMVVSWANGLYPKGSYGRLASGSAFAVLLAVWLVLLLLASDLQEAVTDYGPVLQLDRIFILVCLTSVFYFVHAASEFMGCRNAWRKSLGAEVKVAHIDLESGFLDFDPHIGKLQGGSSSALKAYAKFLVVPTVALVVADWIIGGMNLAAKDVLQASVGSMFGIVLMFGAVMVIIGFVRGFYPSGSLGRTIPGLMGVSALSLYAWMMLLDSGIEDAFGRNHFVIDMYAVLLPVLMYVMFMAVFELAELVDNRRGWHKGLGVPVKPCLPEEEYHCYHDFCCRYTSFIAGAKKGRKVVDKYAFRRILVVIVLEAVVVSAYQYSDSVALRDSIGLILSDQTLSSHMDLNHMIYVMVLLAVANTAGLFLAWSYREGSMSRLAMSGVVAVFASLWAYVFWGTLADATEVGSLATMIRVVMFASIALACVKAIWALSKGYLKNRETYLRWRSTMLLKEAGVDVPRQVPGAPGPVIT